MRINVFISFNSWRLVVVVLMRLLALLVGGYKQWIPLDWTGLDCWVKIVDGRPCLHPTHASHMFACLHYG